MSQSCISVELDVPIFERVAVMPRVLFSFGHGYSAQRLSQDLTEDGWRVIGTTRTLERARAIEASGAVPLIQSSKDFAQQLIGSSHLLISAGPTSDGDPLLAIAQDIISEHADRFEWVGYLSTTGVYGDRQGGWVDEDAALLPSTERGQRRRDAEAEWQAIPGLPLHIFRLAGIYGPGRGPFAKVKSGKARRIIKPGQVFSRIHVDDIAQILRASIARPAPGAIYNLCDDDPAPPQDVIAYAAQLLGMPTPPEIDYDTAEMTPMARSFYAENKRVHNDRIKTELGIKLRYPSYRDGLRAMLKA